MLNERELDLIQYLVFKEIETFGNKNNLLCIEYEELLEKLKNGN